MALDFLVGGMPRGGTTVAAKFMSLPQNMFCYAGETHLIPFMHGMFGCLPCLPEKVDLAKRFLHQQFSTAMVEMPRFSVSQGAHPKNLIFDETSVNHLVEAVGENLAAGRYGYDLYNASLATLADVLSSADPRTIRGEKTPSNLFAMADYADSNLTKNIVVMREPFGALKSMKARVQGGDKYAHAFEGAVEANIGMYLEYAHAARRVMSHAQNSMLIRYEDMALAPRDVMTKIFDLSGQEAEERVMRFVEQGRDPEIANRAPVNYRRLKVTTELNTLIPIDVWKIYNLTSRIRENFGYSDDAMRELGFEIPSNWPGGEILEQVLPLYGFHEADTSGSRWMKKRGGVVVYLSRRRASKVTLHFRSNFPTMIDGQISLDVLIDGELRERAIVRAGDETISMSVLLREEDIAPMGTGGYVIVELNSEKTYCELGHSPLGVSALEYSFRLMKNFGIEKKFRWKWW